MKNNDKRISLNEYLKELRVESGLNIRDWLTLKDMSSSLMYKYEQQTRFSPLEVSNICLTYGINIEKIREFDFEHDLNIDEFIEKVYSYAYGKICRIHQAEIWRQFGLV